MTDRLPDLRNSVGCYAKIDGHYFLDARTGKHGPSPPLLGYNASALFGVVHRIAGCEPENTVEGVSEPPLFSASEKIRQEIETEILNQFPDAISNLNEMGRDRALAAVSHYLPIQLKISRSKQISGEPLPASYHLETPTTDSAIELQRELKQAGILVDQRGSTIEFRLHLGFRVEQSTEFWRRMANTFAELGADSATSAALSPLSEADIEEAINTNHANYEFHSAFLKRKKNSNYDPNATLELPKTFDLANWFSAQPLTQKHPDLRMLRISEVEYPSFRERILKMQTEIYEPARQSPPEEFDMLFRTGRAIGILILEQEAIVGMSFAGPLASFTNERGVLDDPFLAHPDVFYSMDLTVVPRFQKGLGKILKQAVVLQAVQDGVTAIHGRNRDRVARGMWAINLSLGSYLLKLLPDDYPDQDPYRDCFYYRCPLLWNLDSSNSESLADLDLNLPKLVNGF